MSWTQLLSNKRLGEKETKYHDETRSRFEQDFDRIIFSNPFRKLQDKTQVFPFPEDDFVHTRLTHSLEVSSVGRSLGKNAGAYLLKNNDELRELGYSVHDFGAIVAAASLAHDVGNPPFGHSGETSISSFFQSNEKGLFFKDKVAPTEWKDLISFEGNAQGLRVLSRGKHGLNLTTSTLGAFVKYPLSSHATRNPKRKSQKKYGYYQSDRILFQELAQNLGVLALGKESWCRHPLTFLVEAADDICYHIIDLEDACRLGIITFEETKNLLAELLGKHYSETKLNRIASIDEKLATLRALTISQLVLESSEVFQEKEEAMRQGFFDEAITSLIPSAKALNAIMELSKEKIYRSKLVLEKETGGFEVIASLVEAFSIASYDCLFGQNTPKNQSILNLLPMEFSLEINKEKTVYEMLQTIIDFISDLTDSQAVRLYKTLKGLRLSLK